jgi:hypothetical protein
MIYVMVMMYSEETRRKREEVTVQLRKDARDDKLLAKRRTTVKGGAVGAGVLASPSKDGDDMTSEDKQVTSNRLFGDLCHVPELLSDGAPASSLSLSFMYLFGIVRHNGHLKFVIN